MNKMNSRDKKMIEFFRTTSKLFLDLYSVTNKNMAEIEKNLKSIALSEEETEGEGSIADINQSLMKVIEEGLRVKKKNVEKKSIAVQVNEKGSLKRMNSSDQSDDLEIDNVVKKLKLN